MWSFGIVVTDDTCSRYPLSPVDGGDKHFVESGARPGSVSAAARRFEGAIMSSRRFVPAALGAAVAVLSLISCNSGPSAPEPGSPAFYWGAAGETWRSGDYLKTLDDLSHLTASQNEFTGRARPWEIVVASGIVRGEMDLLDAGESAARKAPARAGQIRRQMSAWRATGNSTTLELADTFQKFTTATKQDTVPLEFTWPPVGNPAPPLQLDRFAAGTPLSAADFDHMETAMIQRGVMLTTARATGSGEDTAKAQQVFRQAKPAVATETFMVGMAQVLYDIAALYGPKQLDMPNRHDMLVTLVTNALKVYPKDKDAAALSAKIEKDAKAKARR